MAKRKGEKFKRIKCSTLAKLLQENNNEESVYALADMQDQVGSMHGSYFSSLKWTPDHRLHREEVQWDCRVSEWLQL